MTVEAFMWNESKSALKAILWTKFVHYDLKINRSKKHSDELMHFFKEIENPLDESVSFEKRVENLKLVGRVTPNKN